MLETLILLGLGIWLALALRACASRRGGCSGSCEECNHACRQRK